LRKWKFSPAEMDGRRVAYVGRMEFTVCNICGESGPSMTIVKWRLAVENRPLHFKRRDSGTVRRNCLQLQSS
jgi:hypothetical protein